MDGVSVDELYGFDTSAVDLSDLVTHHVQHVAVREERAWEVEADGERLFVGWLVKLDDRSLYLTLHDAVCLHSIHVSRDVLIPASKRYTLTQRQTTRDGETLRSVQSVHAVNAMLMMMMKA